MLAGPQPSTDQGDPADTVGAEPTPNGGRINLGAFGGTADAELSAPAAVAGVPGAPTPTPSTPTAIPPAGQEVNGPNTDGAGGCAVGGRPNASALGPLILVVFAAVRSRRRASRRR